MSNIKLTNPNSTLNSAKTMQIRVRYPEGCGCKDAPNVEYNTGSGWQAVFSTGRRLTDTQTPRGPITRSPFQDPDPQPTDALNEGPKSRRRYYERHRPPLDTPEGELKPGLRYWWGYEPPAIG
jgi:hypothetical protein